MRTALLTAILLGVPAPPAPALQPPVPGRPVPVNVFHLKNADARKLSRIITDVLGNRVTSVAVDDRTNSLIVAADPETLELMRKLVTRLDEGPKK
jgi:type II secretory pathway component GspD/PulD (secretin)